MKIEINFNEWMELKDLINEAWLYKRPSKWLTNDQQSKLWNNLQEVKQ